MNVNCMLYNTICIVQYVFYVFYASSYPIIANVKFKSFKLFGYSSGTVRVQFDEVDSGILLNALHT